MQQIKYEDRRNLPNVSAVYVVRSESQVLYVGSSWTLRQRFISHHRRDAFLAHNATFIEWEECPDDQMADIERKLVRKLSPLLNIAASRPKEKKIRQKVSTATPQLTSWRDACISALSSYVEGKPKEKTLVEISEATGVSVGWLKQLLAGNIDNPGILYIESVSGYLKKAN